MTRLTMNFDAVAAATPQNATAASVRDGSGEAYDKPIGGVIINRWLAPPPMKKVSTDTDNFMNTAAQVVGQRFGRVVVLGVWDGGNPKKKALWVVRCDCGYYEGWKIRTVRSLGDQAACSHCQQTDRLRRMAAQPSTSKTRKASARALDRIARGVAP